MRTKLKIVLAILALSSPAAGGERTLGPISEQSHVEVGIQDHGNGERWLINDGSFENGECGAGSDWTCSSSNSEFLPILDPLPIWGYAAYDGSLCAWMGGYYDGDPISNSVCQDVWIEGYCGGGYYNYQWMGYVSNDGGNFLFITVDGDVIYEKELTLADHTYGIWSFGGFFAEGYYGTHNLCFEFVATTGANMLVDYITTQPGATAVQEATFSAIKSLY